MLDASGGAFGPGEEAWLVRHGTAESFDEIEPGVEVDFIDSQLSGDEARNALIQACEQDFAIVVDYPDAVTNGLRRTLDALRAVLERSRGDVTTTVLQTRLQQAIEGSGAD